MIVSNLRNLLLEYLLLYQYMEIEETVKISFQGRELAITKQSIMNLEPLITMQQLRSVRLPYCIRKFSPSIDVLHSCLYYLISVEKGLRQSCSLTFREKCLSSISEYYIQQKMNFELYEYAYVCGKILSIPIDKVMHMIYFLVYTRLASKPFINTLIDHMESKRARIRKYSTKKSEKQSSLYTKSHGSRHLTVFLEANQVQVDNLSKELKQIMSPLPKQSKKMTKKVECKRYFNLTKVYPDEVSPRVQTENEPDRLLKSLATSRINSIPVKVRNNQNSSIITQLKFRSGSSEDVFKKIQVRRQKFREWLDTQYKIDHLTSNCDSKESVKVQWGTLKKIKEKSSKNLQFSLNRSQKNPFQHYKQIATGIRNKNYQLDHIRFECIHHTTNHLFNQAKYQ